MIRIVHRCFLAAAIAIACAALLAQALTVDVQQTRIASDYNVASAFNTPSISDAITSCANCNRLQLLYVGSPLACEGLHGQLLKQAACRVAESLLSVGSQSHKKLWPLNARDWTGLFLAAASLFIAAGGGLGGGALLVPIYILIMGFSTRQAVALSNITIVGGAIANFIINIGREHPHKPRPLIDWDIILVMEPATILGALIGGYVNKVIPSWLTTILLALLLGTMSTKLGRKALGTWKVESAKLLKAVSRKESAGPVSNSPASAVDAEGGGDLQEALLSERVIDGEGGDGDSSDEEQVVMGTMVKNLRTLSRNWSLQREKQLPPVKFGVLVVLFFGVLGSDLSKNLFACGSWKYWLAVVSVLPVVGVIMLAARQYLVKEYHNKLDRGISFQEGDVKWDEYHTVVYPAVSTLAGLVAGMFGVGGGIVKGPLMLEMGVLADVAAATSATMILFTSASASVVYISFGAVEPEYGAVVCALGFGVTLVGQLLIYQLIKLLKRRSIIIFTMTAFTAISAVVVAIQASRMLYTAITSHNLWDWGSICA